MQRIARRGAHQYDHSRSCRSSFPGLELMAATARARRFLVFMTPFAVLSAGGEAPAANSPASSLIVGAPGAPAFRRPEPGRLEVPQSRALPGNVVEVRASEFSFQAPDTIPAGLTSFELRQTGLIHRRMMTGGAARDSGALDQGDDTRGFHMMWLVQLDSGKTVADFYAAVQARASGSVGRMLGGPGFALPPRTSNATMVLQPGNYVIVCHVGSARADRTRSHALKGMFRALTVVRAPQMVMAASSADLVATIGPDGRMTFSAPITAGRVLMRIENAHASNHEVQFRRILPGRTVAEAMAWRLADSPTTPRPFEPWAGVSDVPAGGSLMTTIDFEAGDYFVGNPRVAFTVARKGGLQQPR